MILQFDNDLLTIAHRGASGFAPENTMAAFEKAYEMGADGFECDVQLTKDGYPILLHDYTLERTTNGTGFALDKRLAGIKKLDAGSWYGPEFAGITVPTLDDVFAYAKGKMLLNIELKKSPQPEQLVEEVCSRIREYNVLDQCLITSFDEKAVTLAGQCLPDCHTGLLIDKPADMMWEGGWTFLAVKHELINVELLKNADRENIKIVTWTVNEESDMQRLLDMGVGRMITNYPDRLNKLLAMRG